MQRGWGRGPPAGLEKQQENKAQKMERWTPPSQEGAPGRRRQVTGAVRVDTILTVRRILQGRGTGASEHRRSRDEDGSGDPGRWATCDLR